MASSSARSCLGPTILLVYPRESCPSFPPQFLDLRVKTPIHRGAKPSWKIPESFLHRPTHCTQTPNGDSRDLIDQWRRSNQALGPEVFATMLWLLSHFPPLMSSEDHDFLGVNTYPRPRLSKVVVNVQFRPNPLRRRFGAIVYILIRRLWLARRKDESQALQQSG
jgi:hypothetical protein